MSSQSTRAIEPAKATPELIDGATLARIERRLREVQFGEVVVVIHQGRVQEIKTTRRERPGE